MSSASNCPPQYRNCSVHTNHLVPYNKYYITGNGVILISFLLYPLFAAGVVDTGGKFAGGVDDVSDNFFASVVDTGGKFATGVVDNGVAPWLSNISADFRKNSKQS